MSLLRYLMPSTAMAWAASLTASTWSAVSMSMPTSPVASLVVQPRFTPSIGSFTTAHSMAA